MGIRRKLFFFSLITVLFLVLGLGVANTGDRSSNPDQLNNSNDHFSKVSPNSFRNNWKERVNEEIIVIKGEIPEISSQENLSEWHGKLNEIIAGKSSFQEKIVQEYMLNGSVKEFGTGVWGSIDFAMDENYTIEEINSIYSEIEKRGGELGVEKPLVVFYLDKDEVRLQSRQDKHRPIEGGVLAKNKGLIELDYGTVSFAAKDDNGDTG